MPPNRSSFSTFLPGFLVHVDTQTQDVPTVTLRTDGAIVALECANAVVAKSLARRTDFPGVTLRVLSVPDDDDTYRLVVDEVVELVPPDAPFFVAGAFPPMPGPDDSEVPF